MSKYRDAEVKEGIRKRLYGFTTDFESESNAIRARLFGFMMDLASDVVRDFRSDFYHDSQWITRHVNGETTIAYGIRKGGTFIGDAEYWADAVPFNEQVWLIKITEDDGEWFAIAIQVK